MLTSNTVKPVNDSPQPPENAITETEVTSLRLRTFVLRFDTPIAQWEVPLLRGAVIQMAGQNVLFHNHDGDDHLRYGYPLVQYKRIGGKATIVFVGDDGVDAASSYFAVAAADAVQLGDREARLVISHADARHTTVGLRDDVFHYSLRKFLPLNQKNYARFMATDSLAERTQLLERTLTAAILSFATGVGLRFAGRVALAITSMHEPRLYAYKGVKMMGFDLEFRANVSLPDYIGLGKGSSLGFGTLKRITKQQ